MAQQVKDLVLSLQWLGCCCSAGSIPGSGTSTSCGHGKNNHNNNKILKIKGKKETEHCQYTRSLLCPFLVKPHLSSPPSPRSNLFLTLVLIISSFSLRCFVLFFVFGLFVFLGPHLQHMEVPRLEVQSELLLLAYARDTATQDPSSVCDLHYSSRQ